MSTELTKKTADGIEWMQPSSRNTELDECLRVANIFAQSGFFKDAADVAKQAVKMLAGRELGFGYFQSQKGIHIIKTGGKNGYEERIDIGVSAHLMASAAIRKGYKFRVKKHTKEVCTIHFFDRSGEFLGESEFTIAEARQAELIKDRGNWIKYPKNMLWARAIANGVRWYCSDAMTGGPYYTPDELGIEIEEVEGTPLIEQKPETAPRLEAANGNGSKPQSDATAALQAKLDAKKAKAKASPTPAEVAEIIPAGPGDAPGRELYDTDSDLEFGVDDLEERA